ncbi:hypothetical protein [Brevibacillus laterosporus]|uniref:hypothetical protein n=1 Tax=Brevibacillus laterosporus TaxID=1465 RepID=UPI003D24B2E7
MSNSNSRGLLPFAVQQYDRERGSAKQRGYDAKWRKARIGFLRKHDPSIEDV